MKKLLLLTGLFVGILTTNSYSQCAGVANAGFDQNGCINDTIQLSAASISGQYTGTWSTSGFGSFSNPNDTITQYYPDFSDTNTIAMIWTVDSAGACSESDTMLLTLNSAYVWINGNNNICQGGSTTITAGGAQTYNWDNGLGAGSSQTIAPSTTTTYTVVGNTNGCTATDQITVTVNPAPTTPNAGTDQSVCSNSTTLAANNITNGFGSWSVVAGNGIFTDSLDPNTQVSGMSVGTNVFRWSTNGNGCSSNNDDVNIDVYASLTTPNAGPDMTICESSPLVLNANSVGAGETGTWSVISGNGLFNDANNPNTAVTGYSPGCHTYEWTISNGACPDASDNLTICVDPEPSVANAGPDQSICSTTTLMAGNAPIDGTGLWSIVSGTGTVPTPTDPTSSVTGLSGTTMLQWTISTGGVCPDQVDSITITTTTSAPASVNITTQSNSVCSGSTVVLQANPVNGGNSPAYQWYQDGNAIGGATSDTVIISNVTSATEIKVELTSSLACANPITALDSIQLTIENPVDANVGITASKSTICGSEPVKFTVTTADNMGNQPTYYWMLNSSLVAQNTLTITLANLNNGDQLDLVAASNYSCINDVDDTASITLNVIGSQNITTDIIKSNCTQANGSLLINGLTPSTSIMYTVYKEGIKVAAPSLQTTDGTGTLTLSGYKAGNYQVDITDGGCTANYPIKLEDTTDLVVNVSTTIATCETRNGRAWPSISGGVSPYTYVWDNGRTDSLVNNLGSGKYSITVTDAQGCKQIVEVEIQDSCDISGHGLIKGFVFDDLNGDGVKQPNEKGLGGVRVNLGGFLYTYTNPAGHYIAHVAYGTYNVSVVSPTVYSCGGYINNTPVVSIPVANSYNVTLSSGSKQSFNNDFGLITPEETCSSICGKVFEDIDGNGAQNGMELGLSNIGVILQGNGIYRTTKTSLNGEYCFEVPTGVDYQISLSLSNTSYYCNTASGQTQTTPSGAISANAPSSNNVFGVQKSSSFDVQVYSIRPYTSLRPGQCFNTYMDIKMSSPITEACTLTVTHDPLVTIHSAWHTPTSIASGVTTWIFPAGTYIRFACFKMFCSLSSSASQGQSLNFSAEFTCNGGDACSANNIKTKTVTVRAPYFKLTSANAPNNLEVVHTGDESSGDVTIDDNTFSYVVNYQHVGEDTVFSMTIIDTIPDELDITTISTPFSSDNYTMSIVEPNIVVFEFTDMMLIGSDINELESYGFIQYNIKTDPGIQVNDVIQNSATILFNNTDEIKTNTTSNKVVSPNSVEDEMIEPTLSVFPNPTNGQINIVHNFGNGSTVTVYDITGREITQILNNEFANVDMSVEPQGLYFVRVENGKKVLTAKFVKE